MSSPQKKKFKANPAPQPKKTAVAPTTAPAVPVNPLRLSIALTVAFFLVALFGLLHHEMWRDEHQAWLVARDAHSLAQVFDNVRYEGNPALWHTLLFIITCFTTNPVYMQFFHLLIACSFIFVFNRYAPLDTSYKILFTFGYFPLYEYAVISRSYGLGILLVFVACTLYKNRQSHYLLLGIVLALLANVTIYGAMLSLSLAGILFLDYFFNPLKSMKMSLRLLAGLSLFLLGFILSIYQILPEPDNSFPSAFASSAFDFERWSFIASKFFSTYFYIPEIKKNFWNTNIFSGDILVTGKMTFWQALHKNPGSVWVWVYLPCLTFLTGLILFLRKPLVLLLYAGATMALMSVYYYTLMAHARYCGNMLVVLIAAYWLAEYYPDRKYSQPVLRSLSEFGRKINKQFLFVVLLFQVAGSLVAYSMDYRYKFSTSQDAAAYILENKLDTLPMAGVTDFSISPISSYTNKPIFYPQMRNFGSFTIWNNKRQNQMNFSQMVDAIDTFMTPARNKVLFIKDRAPKISADGITFMQLERGMIKSNLQIDLLKSYDSGIVEDEKYFIYLVQRVDSTKVDFNKYPPVN